MERIFGSSSNPYDEIVLKATDEKQVEANWDVLLTIWETVNSDGETGARNVVAALQKRLQHRSANVQLFALTLADALVNNCQAPLHKEISSKVFTQTLVRIVNDRNTHGEVKKRIIKLIDEWVRDHSNDSNFDLMSDTRDSLRSQNHRVQEDDPPPSSGPSDDDRRREEVDIQQAIAESEALSRSTASQAFSANATSSSSSAQQSATHNHNSTAHLKSLPRSPVGQDEGFSTSSIARTPAGPKRVRALYDFDASNDEELPFRVGEVVNVVDCIYAEWWKGELRGRIGIFPAVYVEVIDDLPVVAAASESEMEAQLFAQSSSIDSLLSMMRNLEGKNQDIADNDELQDLYHQSMALRPQVVKLIEKYNQKQEELRAINDKFARAQSTYQQLTTERSQPRPYIQQQQRSASTSFYPSSLQGQSRPVHSPQQSQSQPPPPNAVDPMAGLSEKQRLEYQTQLDAYYVAQREYEEHQKAVQYHTQQPSLQQQPTHQYHAPQQTNQYHPSSSAPFDDGRSPPVADPRLPPAELSRRISTDPEQQQAYQQETTHRAMSPPRAGSQQQQERYPLQRQQSYSSSSQPPSFQPAASSPAEPHSFQPSSSIVRSPSQSHQQPSYQTPPQLQPQQTVVYSDHPTMAGQEPIWNGVNWVYPYSQQQLQPQHHVDQSSQEQYDRQLYDQQQQQLRQEQSQQQRHPSLSNSAGRIGYTLVDPMQALAIGSSGHQATYSNPASPGAGPNSQLQQPPLAHSDSLPYGRPASGVDRRQQIGHASPPSTYGYSG